MTPFYRYVLRSILTIALLCPAVTNAQDFLGLRLGMTAAEASTAVGKQLELANLKLISGKRILNDTIRLPECSTAFRRSMAFDTLQQLKVVGLTHRGDSTDVENVKSCALSWLEKKYGAPEVDSITNDTVVTYIWRDQDAFVTLDAKPYNERHWFVLVYYFQRETYARKEN